MNGPKNTKLKEERLLNCIAQDKCLESEGLFEICPIGGAETGSRVLTAHSPQARRIHDLEIIEPGLDFLSSPAFMRRIGGVERRGQSYLFIFFVSAR